ncbi:unnamed protein product [Ceutorhynchus assimilis]|uniref:Uncharacterized protein n=1 Tax=Ceutorhynchus assimilis TaxID=467358 RepID=A0A9N9MR38_9CUCU|nr:unnamed protein product [Ceutorhynchus assimilis]
MLLNNVFVILVLTFVSKSVLGKPASARDKSSSAICYDLNCPDSTKVCGKRSETSSTDKTKLNVQIQCLDSLQNIILSKNTTEDNPFSPGVYYKGSKLSSVIKSDSLFLDFSVTNTDDDDDQEIHLFPVYLTHDSDDYPSRPKTGPKSEVEDLNNR